MGHLSPSKPGKWAVGEGNINRPFVLLDLDKGITPSTQYRLAKQTHEVLLMKMQD